MSIKSLNNSAFKGSSSSESFDLNFKQIEQTNQILNNIEGKLNSFFKKKKRNDTSSEKSPKKPPPKQTSYEDSLKKTNKNLFSNSLINQTLSNFNNNCPNDENFDDLQLTEQKIQEDLGSLKQRLREMERKSPLISEEKSESSESWKDRSVKFQGFKEKNDDISSNYYQEKIKLLEEKHEIYSKENTCLREDKDKLQKDCEKFKEMLAIMNKNHAEELKNSQKYYEETVNELETIKSERNLSEMRFAELQSKYRILQEENEDLKEKYQKLLQKSSHTEDLVRNLQEEVNCLENKYKSALSLNESEKEINSKSKNNDFNVNEEVTQLLSSYKLELEKIKAHNKEISQHFHVELNKLQSELTQQKTENLQIKDQLFSLKNSKTHEFQELENQHQLQIVKNQELKQMLDKLSSKNKEDFKNFNKLYQDIYGENNNFKQENIEIKENHSLINVGEKKTMRIPLKSREKNKRNASITNKSTSKSRQKSSLLPSLDNSCEKENKFEKCQQEIQRLKDLVNTKISLKKKEKKGKIKKK